jgi:NitT/TauT family transport system permease protein
MAASDLPHRAARPAGRWLDHLLAEGLVVGALVGWWALSRNLPDYIFPSPLAVGGALLRLVFDPDFAVNTLASAVRVVVSVLLALLIGGGLALLPYYHPLARDIVHRRLKPLLLSFPSVGWAILATVWFDISDGAVIFVQVAILTPFCLVNISEGIAELDGELLEMSRSFTRSRPRIFLRIILPLLYPYMIAAVRMSYGVGWKVALIAEVFGAPTGLGYLMFQAEQTADLPLTFATCLAIVIFFWLGERFLIDPLSRLYRGTAPARPSLSLPSA